VPVALRVAAGAAVFEGDAVFAVIVLVGDLRIPSMRFLPATAGSRSWRDDFSVGSRAIIRLSIRIGARDPKSWEKRSLGQ
jgi:hypothetical protein